MVTVPGELVYDRLSAIRRRSLGRRRSQPRRCLVLAQLGTVALDLAREHRTDFVADLRKREDGLDSTRRIGVRDRD